MAEQFDVIGSYDLVNRRPPGHRWRLEICRRRVHETDTIDLREREGSSADLREPEGSPEPTRSRDGRARRRAQAVWRHTEPEA